MRDYHIAKDTVLERLQALIKEEKDFLDAMLIENEQRVSRALGQYWKETMGGKNEIGKHLRKLKELHHRFSLDTRSGLPLSTLDFEIIMDGRGGGAQRLLRMRMIQTLDRTNAIFAWMGLPEVPPETIEVILSDDPIDSCDDPNCPVHGKDGLMERLGIPNIGHLTDPVGKIGVRGEPEACDGGGPDEDEEEKDDKDDTDNAAECEPVGARARSTG